MLLLLTVFSVYLSSLFFVVVYGADPTALAATTETLKAYTDGLEKLAELTHQYSESHVSMPDKVSWFIVSYIMMFSLFYKD